MAAAMALLPPGTSHKPDDLASCLGYQLLYVNYPATQAQSWTVKITVTPGGAADCQQFGGDGGRCPSVVGYPGFVGSEVVCSGIPCDQASVYGKGYVADVYSYLSTFDLRKPVVADPSGTSIGVGVLTALTG